MRSPRRPEADREGGQVLVLGAMLMVVVLTMAALVVDLGYARQYTRVAQVSADAAALAAAQDLDGTTLAMTTAVATAKTWALANNPKLTLATWSGCTDAAALPLKPDSANACISFSSDKLTVRVAVPAVVQPVFFGGVVRSQGFKIGASASATKTLGTVTASPGPCGLCVIAGKTLQIAGSTSIKVTGGAIQADSLTANANDSNTAITPVPLRWFNANNSNWGRNVAPAPATFNSYYSQLSAAVPNPFSTVALTYTGLTTDASNINFAGGSNPLVAGRIYTQNVNINSGTLTLAAGTYYFANTLTVASGATLTGTGVTLVFSCATSCSGVEPGKFNFSAGSTVTITAPTSGTYAGLAVMFDPNGTQGTPNQLSGTITLNGSVYAKGGGFNMGSSAAVIKTWTFVAGGNFDANNGTLLIDNNAYYTAVGSSGSGSTGGSTALTS